MSMSSDDKTVPSKGGKRARTREKLLDVATALFADRGISAVSLDEVATQAGLTKGAIYGSFASKDDLIFAVVNERTSRAAIAFDGSTPVRQQLRRIASEALDSSPGGRSHFAFLAELDLYALTREDLSRRFIASARERHLRSAEALERFAAELKLPPLQFALTVQALVSGLLFQRACFPDIVTEEVALEALEALLA